MAISVQQLQQILPNAGRKAGVFVPGLNATMGKYSIITPRRMAAFLAQVGHESGQLLYVRELGNDAYLAKYDTGRLAERLGNTPAADGDGQRYRGRGLIQITGRDNYESCSEALSVTVVCSTPPICSSSRSTRRCRPAGTGSGRGSIASLTRCCRPMTRCSS